LRQYSTGFALRATAVSGGGVDAVLRHAVSAALAAAAGHPELSPAARALLEAPITAPDWQLHTSAIATATSILPLTLEPTPPSTPDPNLGPDLPPGGTSIPTTGGRPFAPGGGYGLLTMELLCDLLGASGGSDHCEHPVVDVGQANALLDCAAGQDMPGHPGRALQVDPMKPTLKASGTKRLKLECDEMLPGFALNSNLRR